MVADDADIAVAIDGTPWVDRKLDAMRAHATQITEDGPFFAASRLLGDSQWSQEFYLFAAGVPFPDCRRLGRRPVRRAGLTSPRDDRGADRRSRLGGRPPPRDGPVRLRGHHRHHAARGHQVRHDGHRGLLGVARPAADPGLRQQGQPLPRAIVEVDTWAISLLAADQAPIARHFSNRGRDLLSQFDDVGTRPGADQRRTADRRRASPGWSARRTRATTGATTSSSSGVRSGPAVRARSIRLLTRVR